MKGLRFRRSKLILTSLTAATVVFSASYFLYWKKPAPVTDIPKPLLNAQQSVNWWFAFKFNAGTFPGCTPSAKTSACAFGGTEQTYPYGNLQGQQFVYASNANPNLVFSSLCLGKSNQDPLGATFDKIYNNRFYYVIWNDQFKGEPHIPACGKESTDCFEPWAHSKGMLVWNDAGQGLVLQVTTPSWPAAGSKKWPRPSDGNTLGCVKQNNLKLSQHFFALELTKEDLVKVLHALRNASIVTDIHNPQLVNNGGPQEIQQLVNGLGTLSNSSAPTHESLSSGVEILSKPSELHVAPWRLVSSMLGGMPLKIAVWWSFSKHGSTLNCWNPSFTKPGPITVALSGQYQGRPMNLTAESINHQDGDTNHAKIGVSLDPHKPYTIFGDMNENDKLKNCSSGQNGRGGLFYVLHNKIIWQNVSDLLKGQTHDEKQ